MVERPAIELRYQIVGASRHRIREVKKGLNLLKIGSLIKSRSFAAFEQSSQEPYYAPLEEIQTFGFDTAAYPRITVQGALFLAGINLEDVRQLINARKRKTTIPYTKLKPEGSRPDWRSKLTPNASEENINKMRRAFLINDLSRAFRRGEITLEQLALILLGSGLALTEPKEIHFLPGLEKVELPPPIRPFNPEKFKGSMTPELIADMKKQHIRQAAAISGRIFPRRR